MNYDSYELANGSIIYPLFEFQKDNKKYLGFVESIPFTKEDIIIAIEENDTLLPVENIEELKPIIDNLITSLMKVGNKNA